MLLCLLEDLVSDWILMLPVPSVIVSLSVDMQSSHKRLLDSGVPANIKRRKIIILTLFLAAGFASLYLCKIQNEEDGNISELITYYLNW